MGAKLEKAYQIAKDKAGAQGRMRLAILTKVPSNKAGSEPDSPDNIQKFEQALKEITGENIKL